MFVITVLPIARGILKENLTYFSKEAIALSSIVSVPLRKKTISGIVLDCQNATSLRSELKNLSYPLKKIKVDSKGSFIAPYFLKAVKDTAKYFASTEGAVINSMVPKVLFELGGMIEKNVSSRDIEKPEKSEFISEFLSDEKAMQVGENERYDAYKSIIREAFAKKESVFIIVPREELAKKILEKLSKGIEEYSLLFTSSLTKKKMKESVAKNLDSPHPLFVVGTYVYLPLIRVDTRTIIIEEESSRYWKQNMRPYIDIRYFLRCFTRYFKTKIIYADSLIGVETYHRMKGGEIALYGQTVTRGHKTVATLLIDMKKKKESGTDEKPEFEVLSPELKEMLVFGDVHKKNIFLLGTRRGLSPQTLCRDCQHIVECQKCEAPVVLYKGKDGNNFICHHCGAKRSAMETCLHCGGWRLESFGIGLERIVDEVKKVTSSKVWQIDSEVAKKPENIKKIIAEFQEKKGVLVGTELALNFLEEYVVPYSAIVSFDSLFALPDFRMEERIMHLIIKAKSVASESFLVQGRNLENPVVEYAASEDFSNFMRYEIDSRRSFGYPPFKTLIKITITGKKEMVCTEVKKIGELLKEYSPLIFPAFIKTIKGQTISHILIKLDPSLWPDKKILQKLLLLPPSVTVKVDPESLL